MQDGIRPPPSAGNDEFPVPEGLEPGLDQPVVLDPEVVERDEVDQLEEKGIIGPSDGMKSREVLL